jgi:hypothetical protein
MPFTTAHNNQNPLPSLLQANTPSRGPVAEPSPITVCIVPMYRDFTAAGKVAGWANMLGPAIISPLTASTAPTSTKTADWVISP